MIITANDWLHVPKKEDFIDTTEETFKVGGVLVKNHFKYEASLSGGLGYHTICREDLVYDTYS